MSSLPDYSGVAYIHTESPGFKSEAEHIKYILQTSFGAYFGLRLFCYMYLPDFSLFYTGITVILRYLLTL